MAKAIETEQSTRPSTTRMVVWSQRTTGDIYSINEPQISLNSMIAFCLNMHNEAVRALRFPPNTHREKESEEKRREMKQQEEELAKYMAEEDDDDF